MLDVTTDIDRRQDVNKGKSFERFWDEEKLKQLAALWNDQDMTASECAAEMRLASRSAVIGAIHRHNGKYGITFKTHKSAGGVAKGTARSASHVARRLFKKAKQERRSNQPTPPDVQFLASELFTKPKEDKAPKTFADLQPGECCWPIGNLFCGDASVPRKNYCNDHLFYSQKPRKVS